MNQNIFFSCVFIPTFVPKQNSQQSTERQQHKLALILLLPLSCCIPAQAGYTGVPQTGPVRTHTHTHAHKLTQLLELAVSQVPATANTALFALNWFLGSKSHDTSRKLKLSWQSETESRKETTVQHNFLSSLSWYTHCCSSNKCPLNTTPSSFLAPLSFQTVIRSYQTPNSASICSTHQHLESALAVLTWGKDTHIS